MDYDSFLPHMINFFINLFFIDFHKIFLKNLAHKILIFMLLKSGSFLCRNVHHEESKFALKSFYYIFYNISTFFKNYFSVLVY